MSGELLFGIHSIDAALTHDPKNILELYFETNSDNPRIKELSERARDLGLKPHSRDRGALDRMTGGARHQGAVARYKAPPPRAESDLYELVEQAGSNALLLVLDGVTDPHNLGACLRSAEAAGVTAVVVPKDKAAGITPTVRRASSGAADRVAFFAVTNLARTLKALKELLCASGLTHPEQIGPEHVIRRVSSTEVRSLAALHHWVKPNSLIDGSSDHPVFKVFWEQARHDTFAAPPNVLTLQTTKMR
jgi:tRNA G18 (ribose-2'-O)-methylase SpoU